jgi:hypothetical protein
MKRTRISLAINILCAALFIAVVNSVAQNKEQNEAQKAALEQRFSWTRDEWTGDDRPYTALRQKIDKAIADGQKPDDLLSAYGKTAQSQPNNPQAQFA